MNSTELNKIAGAAIGALLVFLLLNFFSGMIYDTRGGHAAEGEDGPVLAYAVEVEAAAGGGEAEEPQIDLHAVFASADAAAGESLFRACGACHALEPGQNKVGPSLYDVVGHDIASVEGFSYSDAMASHEGSWTPELLFAFLENPKAVVPGTKMSYAGMKNPADRANLIAFLNETGDSPVDLLEGLAPLAPTEDAAAAEGETEVAAAGEAAGDVAISGEPGDDQGGGAVTGEAPAVVTPESATETTTSAMQPAQPDTTVTEVETVDADEVETDATTPAEAEAEDEAADAAEPQEAEAADEGEQVAQAPAAEEGGAAEGGGAQAALGGDPEAGEKIFRRCRACHKIEEGANGIGPSLHGIVGKEIASVEGFNYSDAMKAHGGTWTPEFLAEYLADPKGTIPGNKMAFAGIKGEKDLLDLITYLQQAGQ